MKLDASMERTFVSVMVMAMSTALLIALPNEAAVLIPLVGTWMGALIANWFNGIQQPPTPQVKNPVATSTTTVVTQDQPHAN